MYCTCCGKKIMDDCNFCPECGVKLNMEAKRGIKNTIGEARNVMLITGEVKELYFYNGLYYYDKFCTRIYPIGMVSPSYRFNNFATPAFMGFGFINLAILSKLNNKGK